MSATAGVLAMAVALVVLAVVVNQVQARLALIEVTLTEGLPPGHASAAAAARADTPTPVLDPEQALPAGVHIFVSRSCHACQRLVEEMEHAWRPLDASVSLRFVDRPRPFARELAATLGITAVDHDAELSRSLAADPLPYTIAVGAHGLVARSVTPTVRLVQDVARDAGMRVEEAAT